mgnify:FL=1
MDNNIFATFLLGKAEEQLEIDCKAFSTAEKQNEYFEKTIKTIETEKIQDDIRYYNRTIKNNYYNIHNGWFTYNTVSFEFHKINSSEFSNISAGDKIYIGIDYEESSEENVLKYYFNTDISKLKEELKYKWDYYKQIDKSEPGMYIYEQDDNQIIVKGIQGGCDIPDLDEDDFDVFMDEPSRMVTCFLKIFELTVE